MPQKIRFPTAEQLYSDRKNIAKDSFRALLAEARELATWAGRRVPNGPAAGALMHGYHVGFDDLDLAIAMIVARARETPKMASESRAARNHRQLAVRDTGKCDSCGAEFIDATPAFASGPAKRTRKQWAAALRSTGAKVRLSEHEASILFPGDHDLSGFGSEQPWDAGAKAAARVRPRKEKIPNHNRTPTGKHPKSSKGKSK